MLRALKSGAVSACCKDNSIVGDAQLILDSC